MKSEHRHHLAENDLEHRLAELAERLKPYSRQILYGTLGLAAIAIIAVVVFNNLGASDRDAWAAFAACRNASQYEEMALAYPDSTAAQWAWINAGESQLQSGVRRSFDSRTVAVDNLEDAQEAFEQVLNNPDALPEARERALNGLARTLESLSDGDTQPAIEAYQKLIDDFPESPYREWAENRIEQLSRPETQEFYAWYHAQHPDPAQFPVPDDFPGTDDEFEIPPLLDPDTPGLPAAPESGDDVPPPPDAESTTDEESDLPESETPMEETAEDGETAEGPQLGPPSEEPADDEESAPATESDETAPADSVEGDASESPDDTDVPAAEEDANTDAGETPAPDADNSSESTSTDGETSGVE